MKGLYHYVTKNPAFGKQNQSDGKLLDDKIHESLLEATRYVVLFGLVFLSDIVCGLISVIVSMKIERHQKCSLGFPIMEILFFIWLTMFVSSICLSFKFNHDKYDKWCNCCHQRVMHWFETMERKQQKELTNDYTEMSSNNNL